MKVWWMKGLSLFSTLWFFDLWILPPVTHIKHTNYINTHTSPLYFYKSQTKIEEEEKWKTNWNLKEKTFIRYIEMYNSHKHTHE